MIATTARPQEHRAIHAGDHPAVLHADRRTVRTAFISIIACVTLMALAPFVGAQVRVRDLIVADGTVPVRLVGYGLVAGLDGTGDRAMGGVQNGQTVNSIVNLLRRFDIVVPPNMLRSRNVAAVLVTAEVSPYLRPGGRFDLQVASIGDAPSLRGGVLYMTPLVAEPGGPSLATAQGGIVLSDGRDGATGAAFRARGAQVETSGRIPAGGVMEADLPRASFADASTTLVLRDPDYAAASRIAAVIDSVIGQGTARADDPGAVALTLKDPPGPARAAALARIRELPIALPRAARIVIDGRDGTVVAGGDVAVGEAMITHGPITLTIGAADATPAATAGEVRLQPGTSVQRIASALHGVRTSPSEIAAIFTALRDVGAMRAEVVIR